MIADSAAPVGDVMRTSPARALFSSHSASSVGFWPGGPAFPEAAFYSYCYPEPPGFRAATVQPAAARFDTGLGEFVLPYDAVRTSADPDATLLAFAQSTYEAAADAARWDRAALERPPTSAS